MLGTMLAVAGVVGAVLPWLDSTATEIERAEEAQKDLAIRSLTGLVAQGAGTTQDIEDVPEFVEVPPDPALGGKPVLMTHTEAVWWMSASGNPAEHTRRIRKILRAQASRRQALT